MGDLESKLNQRFASERQIIGSTVASSLKEVPTPHLCPTILLSCDIESLVDGCSTGRSCLKLDWGWRGLAGVCWNGGS